MVAPHFSVWQNGKALTSYQHKSLFAPRNYVEQINKDIYLTLVFVTRMSIQSFPSWLHHRSSHPQGRNHSQFHHQPVTFPRDWKYSSRRILADSAVSKPKFSTMNLQMTCNSFTGASLKFMLFSPNTCSMLCSKFEGVFLRTFPPNRKCDQCVFLQV